MSNAALKWADPLNLSPLRKAVLRTLADYADAKTGKCWPCMSTIARVTGYTVRAVRLALRYLEGVKLIRTLHQVGRRSIFWVTFGVPVQAVDEPEQLALDLGALPRETAASDSPPPRNPVPPKESLKVQPEVEKRESAQARAPAPDPLPSRSILPSDWQPSPLDIAFALARGLNVGVIADTFADHYRAMGAIRADWAAAWRNWCRREPQFSRKRRDASRATRDGAGVSEAAAELLAKLDAYEARPIDRTLLPAQLAA